MFKAPFDVNNSEFRDTFFREILPAAIAALQPGTKPKWGKLTAQHMIEHLLWSFEMSTGKVEVECSAPEDKLKGLRSFLFVNRPIPTGFKHPLTDENLPTLRYKNIEEARSAFNSELKLYLDYTRANPNKKHTNAVFGLLRAEEWHRFNYKHCYHHLLQFGLIEQVEPRD